MNPTTQPPNPMLAQLKDIHLPDPVSWWPIAWPWWLLLATLVAIIIFTVFYRRKNAWRKLAIKQLRSFESNDPITYARMCNRLLKQVCFNKLDNSCASLSAVPWLDYLDKQVKHAIFLPKLEAFAFIPDNPDVSIDTEQLKLACLQWIRKVQC
jgi:hypothetical protein